VTRIITLAALALLASCPHRGATSAQRTPDPDATLATAATFVLGHQRVQYYEGELRTEDGDQVDWLRVDAEPGTQISLTIAVRAVAWAPFTFEVYDAAGQMVVKPHRDVAQRGDKVLVADTPSSTSIYLRIATKEAADSVDYQITLTERSRSGTPDGAAPCDPAAYDPVNPLCRDECDFAHPSIENTRCCALWKRCLGPGGFCTARVLNPTFPLWVDLGMSGGLLTTATDTSPEFRASGILELASERIDLNPVVVETNRSRWLLAPTGKRRPDRFVRATTVKIYPSPMCSVALNRGDNGD